MGRTYRKLNKKQKRNLQKFRRNRNCKRNLTDDLQRKKKDESKTDVDSNLFY